MEVFALREPQADVGHSIQVLALSLANWPPLKLLKELAVGDYSQFLALTLAARSRAPQTGWHLFIQHSRRNDS